MKRHVQVEGVRKWAGDHMVELQGEPLQVIDRFFGQFGPYVLQGCEVTPAADGDDLYDVAPGLVVLAGKDRNDADAVMIVPFVGATGVPLPIYLTLTCDVRQREYVSGGVKPIAYDYYAEGSTVQPAAGTPHLLLNDKTPRFVDVIQDTKHSFITEAERTRWNEILSIKPWVNDQLAAFDPTIVGEHRLIRPEIQFTDSRYMPMDGSRARVSEYPDLPFSFPSSPFSDSVTIGNSGYVRRIAYGDGVYLAPATVSGVGCIHRSTDLASWTTLQVSFSAVGLAFGKGRWVAISGGIRTSRDGITWEKLSAYDGLRLDCLKFGGGAFVATGQDGLYTSNDGLTWVKRGVPSDVTSLKDERIAYHNGTWAITVWNGIIVSTDLTTWTRKGPAHSSTGTPHYSIQNCNGLWICGMRGSKQIRIYSADFSTYTDKTISNLNIDQVYQVIFLAGLYIIVQTIPYVSTDLTTWTRSSMTLTAYDVEVLYTPDRGIIIPDYSTAGKIWLVDEWYTLPNYSNAGYKSYLKLYE